MSRLDGGAWNAIAQGLQLGLSRRRAEQDEIEGDRVEQQRAFQREQMRQMQLKEMARKEAMRGYLTQRFSPMPAGGNKMGSTLDVQAPYTHPALNGMYDDLSSEDLQLILRETMDTDRDHQKYLREKAGKDQEIQKMQEFLEKHESVLPDEEKTRLKGIIAGYPSGAFPRSGESDMPSPEAVSAFESRDQNAYFRATGKILPESVSPGLEVTPDMESDYESTYGKRGLPYFKATGKHAPGIGPLAMDTVKQQRREGALAGFQGDPAYQSLSPMVQRVIELDVMNGRDVDTSLFTEGDKRAFQQYQKAATARESLARSALRQANKDVSDMLYAKPLERMNAREKAAYGAAVQRQTAVQQSWESAVNAMQALGGQMDKFADPAQPAAPQKPVRDAIDEMIDSIMGGG